MKGYVHGSSSLARRSGMFAVINPEVRSTSLPLIG
jgi:hypothetical protein